MAVRALVVDHTVGAWLRQHHVSSAKHVAALVEAVVAAAQERRQRERPVSGLLAAIAFATYLAFALIAAVVR
jgi:hypothetical protein